MGSGVGTPWRVTTGGNVGTYGWSKRSEWFYIQGKGISAVVTGPLLWEFFHARGSLKNFKGRGPAATVHILIYMIPLPPDVVMHSDGQIRDTRSCWYCTRSRGFGDCGMDKGF